MSLIWTNVLGCVCMTVWNDARIVAFLVVFILFGVMMIWSYVMVRSFPILLFSH